MKILLTTDWFVPSVNGVVVSTMNLYKELKKRDHDVKILTLSKSDKSYVDGDFYFVRSFDIKVYPEVRASVFLKSHIIDLLIDWKPDIIHSQCEFFTYSFACKIAKKTKAPLVHTYHTLYEYYAKYLFLPRIVGDDFIEKFLRLRLKNSHSIIAPTKKAKEDLEKKKINRKITVIPTGIDLRKFHKRKIEREINEHKKSLNLNLDTKILLSLGRVAREKNIEELLDYLENILKARDDLVFLIVGDGPNKAKIEKSIRLMKLESKVVLTGQVSPDKVPAYYQMADVFLCGSQSETQGLTYIEALANGLPILARQDMALEGVVEDGINGYTYTKKKDFTSKLQVLLDKPSERKLLANKALESSYKFSTDVFADRVYNLYEDTIKEWSINK